MTASTPRNPPPQSPYYSNYAQNGGISPSNGTTKLPGVPEQSNGEEAPEPKKEQRLIVVSNRLPVTIMKDANGEYQFAMSSGGLVSALSGCKKSMSFTWIGWPGKHVSCHLSASFAKADKQIPEADRPLVEKRLLEEYSCYPVYLPDDIAEQHYNGEQLVDPHQD
jgi:trehalose 6-phosphate synthase